MMACMEAAQSVLVAGYKLDRYELLCPIASGGMATVWLAQLRGKRGFEKLFAIKTIKTELLEDPRFQEMFLDEARIASGIQHPNVAQILDLGEQRDILFIVMEWVDGDSLAKIRRLLARRGAKLPTGVALRVLADACAGLHAAHELRDRDGEPLGIVHRDVSPQNILVAASGAVKVIDFGIAKAQNRKQGETRTGVVKGKVQYMAPEQVKKGRTVDRRADIWSLGICLHELIAGKTPNDADDDVEIIRRLLADEAPPIAPGLPDAVVRVLQASIAVDPDTRFPTAAGMQRALDGAMKELGEAATSEDVAAVIRSELPELVDGRRGVVTKAIEGARDRVTPAVTGSGEEAAFAPTMMSERSGPSPTGEAKAIALTKRKEPVRMVADVVSSEDSRVRPSSPPDQEPIEIPKRSRAGVWLMLVLIAAIAAVVARWSRITARFLGAGRETKAVPEETLPPSIAVHGLTGVPAATASSAPLTPAWPTASAAATSPAAHRPAAEPSAHGLPHGVQSPVPQSPSPSAPSPSAPRTPLPQLNAPPEPPAEDPANPYGN
jgi:serine/threonine-protein kinase